MYQQEEEGLRRKLDKHVAENAEKWDIDNTVRALLCFEFPSTCPTVHTIIYRLLRRLSSLPIYHRNMRSSSRSRLSAGPAFVWVTDENLARAQRRMMEESGKMVADASTRLGAVVQELREIVVRAPPNLPLWCVTVVDSIG